ncbi:glycosyltransferase [Hirschia maritima]|uniref:glycosyltransferase n=1 Tax=Hirschia maritima TaxID=1121961 RepID=UPI0003675B8C|nr:glycosyltransferase family A protein [Hirschia maritima]
MTSISVLLASYNGANLLQRTLDGYVALGNPGFDWQIIVVDNASTDNTQDVLSSYKDKLPLTSLFEAEAGKNKALNKGIPLITSDLVVLTDNDSIPHPGFLNQWVEAFSNQPDADVLGASIEPLFDVDMPAWMLENKPRFVELFALREDIPDGPIGADYIFGPNMAVRKSVFDRGVVFDEGVGPNGAIKNYAMGSETAFCRDAEAKGMKLAFASKPCVSHIVRPYQTTQEFRDKRAYRLGLGTARKHSLEGKISPISNNLIIRTLKGIGEPILRSLKDIQMQLNCMQSNPLQKSEAVWNLHFYRGYQAGKRMSRQTDNSLL